ncbi:ABC transporter ATP-binding protein [Allopusillimonas ginsengisoli]|uniref:ABC transporter ATP-binding protein n=1 Tax=Allopusillimonas ginsengisoli TaxID=453575 RepID=UPI001020B31D|nr:ABC transporter ATP-binding protein [Allopusillimonas ginsengisoli]TEA80050.1 ABC transporter ATP-binding protein [Allopusillimonas ginsengisoli]
MSNILIDSVSKRYGDVEVLSGASLTIEHGTVVALLGPSGCGKTTLLRLIAGFDRLDQGRIAFDEHIVAAPSVFVPPERRGIGYVPQEGALFPHLTVEGNVRYGLRKHASGRQRVHDVLALTGLSGLNKRFPHALSGGQQQRVALARALAPDPALILLDEPFNALDLDLRRRMCEDVIDVLRQTGTTTILVTHDPGEAFAVSDQMAVMQAGEIMQCASPETVYWQPANPSVARLTGSTIFLSGEMTTFGMQSPLGLLDIHGTTSGRAGKAWAMLRPEQVRLSAHGPGIPAKVIHRSFRGDHTMLELKVNETRISLRSPSLSAPDLYATVFLSVQGACMAFPDTSVQSGSKSMPTSTAVDMDL